MSRMWRAAAAGGGERRRGSPSARAWWLAGYARLRDGAVGRQLLIRGFERVGLDTPEGSPRELISKLAEGIAVMDTKRTGLARRVVELHREALG